MAEIRPFIFDTRFDLEAQPEPEPEELIEEEEPEEIVPTFSEEEMKTARDEFFAAGKEEGINEAAAATEREIAGALEKLNEQFTNLFKAQEDAESSILDSAVSVAVGVARKAFPALNERNGLAEIERIAVMAMSKIQDEYRVILFVNPEIEAPLKERLAQMTAQAAFKGEFAIVATGDVAAGDCRVDWEAGGSKRDMDLLWQEIDEIVERNLSGESDEPEIPPESIEEISEETVEGTMDESPEIPDAPPQDTPQDTLGDATTTDHEGT